jgi:hypothetical protein
MKRLIFTAAATLCFSAVSLAQGDAITTYFPQYEASEDVTFIELSGKAFDLIEEINAESEDEKRVKDIASQVTGLRMVIDDENVDGKTQAFQARKRINGSFEELMRVKEKDALFYILIDERDGIVYEVLAFGGDNEKFFVADLKGQIRLQDVAEITSDLSKVNNDFMKSGDIQPNDMNIYPNPAARGQELTFELPEELDGAQVLVLDASGKKVHEFVARGKQHKLSAEKLGSGVFILKANKGSFDISKKFMIQ